MDLMLKLSKKKIKILSLTDSLITTSINGYIFSPSPALSSSWTNHIRFIIVSPFTRHWQAVASIHGLIILLIGERSNGQKNRPASLAGNISYIPIKYRHHILLELGANQNLGRYDFHLKFLHGVFEAQRSDNQQYCRVLSHWSRSWQYWVATVG